MMLDKYKVILWDFDGVIMDSNPVRTRGFEEVLKSYPADQVKQLIAYHKQNGGLSRYVKFRYFFEKIRGEAVNEDEVPRLSSEFSDIMLSLLKNKELLIHNSLAFIKVNYKNFTMHIVSGSDEQELRKICDALHLTQYFKTINGSPTPKTNIVKQVLQTNAYSEAAVCLIGDSVNDRDAAVNNGIDFYGYNNTELKATGINYIESFVV